jgi:hypothetical protein
MNTKIKGFPITSSVVVEYICISSVQFLKSERRGAATIF